MAPVEPSLLEWAEYWYPVSWKGVLAAGIITALGACLTIGFLLLQWRTTSLREEQSEWRTSTLELETAKAKAELGIAQADIAKAHARMAEADARTKEAELKLEQLRRHVAARHINTLRFLELLKEKPKQPVEIMFVKDDGEAFQLAIELRSALTQAKWEVQEPTPIPPTATARLANLPSAMGAGGQPSGVSVVARAVSQEDFKMVDPGNDSAFRALSDALGDSLGHVSGAINGDASPKYGTLRVVVGPKINLN